MGRPIFYMSEAERPIDDKLVTEKIEEAINHFADYLETYSPKGFDRTEKERQWPSKHTLMGPVGKILSVMLSGRLTARDALVGFAMNIHNLTSDEPIDEEGIKNLEKAIEAMNELKTALPARRWVRIVREIDYGVFMRKMASEASERR